MDVLLVHGLGRTPLSMYRLGQALRRAGHQPHYFGYAAWAEPYPRIVRRLGRRLRAFAHRGAPCGLVGHSLGGLLLRHAAGAAGLRPAHLVMLGTPNQPPRLARRAVGAAPFRWLTRDCGRRLAEPAFFARLPRPDYPYTIVAGTRGWPSLLSPFGPQRNDGVIAVGEVSLTPSDEVVLLPVSHTFMMNHPAVQRVVLAALSAVPERGVEPDLESPRGLR